MPIASTRPNSVSMLTVKPSSGHRGEGADDRHRHGRRRDQHGPPVLEEHQDHDQHQHAGLEQRLVDLVDRLLDELRRVERDVVLHALRESSCSAAPSPPARRSATSSALAPGQLEDADVRGRLAVASG